jgi:ribose transport system ATP-binding protein
MVEVIGMSDRVLVMHEGKISGELDKGDISEQNIMKLAVGQIN